VGRRVGRDDERALYYPRGRRTYVLTPFDPWRGPLCTCPPKYSFCPYVSCPHGCLYCYITSYIPGGFSRFAPKKDVLRKLARDVRYANPELHVSMANSSDPYPPLEARLRLTRRALEILLGAGFKVLLITKSDLVARDADLLSRGRASVSFTITTLDEALAKRLEPGAPPPSSRLKAIRLLTEAGVPCSLRLDPIIPGLNDHEEEVRRVVREAARAGAKHVVTSTFKPRHDSVARMCRAFPDLAKRWRELYYEEGERVQRARYLPRRLRAEYVRMVKGVTEEEGLTFASCREGFAEWNTATCDGSHLIPGRPVKVVELGVFFSDER